MAPLVPDTETLSAFPGGPFAPSLVVAAGEAVRAEAGWHIAPELTETITLWSNGGPLLKLPTLRVNVEQPLTVTRTRSDGSAEALEPDYVDPDGMLLRNAWWPVGRLQVALTHGYIACPAELLPVLAELAQGFKRDRTIRGESLLSRSVTYGDPEGQSRAAAIARYRL